MPTAWVTRTYVTALKATERFLYCHPDSVFLRDVRVYLEVIWILEKSKNQILVSVMESGFSGSPKEQMSLLFKNLTAGVSYLDLQNTLLVPQDKGKIRLKDKFTQKWKPELV